MTIASRFNGPAESGNGGYTAGLLADRATWPESTRVRLMQPPPLETALSVVGDGTGEGAELALLRGDEPVARAWPSGETSWTSWEPVDLVAAAQAEHSYRGLQGHPFPTCFVCGPQRTEGDGLRIFPGEVRPDTVAATWRTTVLDSRELRAPGDAQDGGTTSLGLPVTWAALDCVSAWSCDLEGRPMVLGEMTARVERLPSPNATYVAMGRHLRSEGRKTWTASALFDDDGRMLGQAEHLWITLAGAKPA